MGSLSEWLIQIPQIPQKRPTRIETAMKTRWKALNDIRFPFPSFRSEIRIGMGVSLDRNSIVNRAGGGVAVDPENQADHAREKEER